MEVEEDGIGGGCGITVRLANEGVFVGLYEVGNVDVVRVSVTQDGVVKPELADVCKCEIFNEKVIAIKKVPKITLSI